jgi:hypothetical protein
MHAGSAQGKLADDVSRAATTAGTRTNVAGRSTSVTSGTIKLADKNANAVRRTTNMNVNRAATARVRIGSEVRQGNDGRRDRGRRSDRHRHRRDGAARAGTTPAPGSCRSYNDPNRTEGFWMCGHNRSRVRVTLQCRVARCSEDAWKVPVEDALSGFALGHFIAVWFIAVRFVRVAPVRFRMRCRACKMFCVNHAAAFKDNKTE